MRSVSFPQSCSCTVKISMLLLVLDLKVRNRVTGALSLLRPRHEAKSKSLASRSPKAAAREAPASGRDVAYQILTGAPTANIHNIFWLMTIIK